LDRSTLRKANVDWTKLSEPSSNFETTENQKKGFFSFYMEKSVRSLLLVGERSHNEDVQAAIGARDVQILAVGERSQGRFCGRNERVG